MAILKTFHCKICMKEIQESRPSCWYDNICYDCEGKKRDKTELLWKMNKETLSVEDRLREIEDFIYHHGKHYKGPTIFG